MTYSLGNTDLLSCSADLTMLSRPFSILSTAVPVPDGDVPREDVLCCVILEGHLDNLPRNLAQI